MLPHRNAQPPELNCDLLRRGGEKVSLILRHDGLFAFAERERELYEDLLKAFVEVPTVSSESDRQRDIKRGVELAKETIRSFGGKVRVHRSNGGNPIIHAVFENGKNCPTITVYNHLDVQPASQETEPWETDPFVMVRKGDRYFGRGTTDDKGPALSALFGIRAVRESQVPINVHLLWEFEEEIGSPHFERGISEMGDRLATDSVVVSDTIWISRQRPANPSSLRGFIGLRFVLETGTTDQHSGNVGGAARNPLGELMKLISDIYDPETGKLKVPGFYDDVIAPTKAELEDFRCSGFTVRGFKRDHLLKSLRTSDPLELMRRIWTLPTFEIHGVAGGYTGAGLKAIVPPKGEVKASCRLVANQQPKKIFRLIKSFVKEKNRDVVVHLEAPTPPYQGTTNSPLSEAVKTSVKFAFGREPVFIGGAGSIGAVISMEKVLKCPVMFLGLSLPEHGYHAPNENFDWRQASGGIVAFAKYFETISEIDQSEMKQRGTVQ
jgi:acetylornithine deacetylase/succinyl-diaminopimelate desuccinylase-like protein